MNIFGNLPQEKAMARLIHDANETLFNLRFRQGVLEKWIKENSQILNTTSKSTTPWVFNEYLKSDIEKLEKALEVYKEKFKNDFPTEISAV